MSRPLCLLLFLLSLLALPAAAQNAERFGDYEVHYSVVYTTFLTPEVASQYQLVRARDRAILNIAIRQHQSDGSTIAQSAKLEGRSWDLFQNTFLEFQEIREGDAIYYIADFEFSDAEIRFFTIALAPAGVQRSHQLKFQRKLYVD
jgi:hypothetical protein